MNKKDECLKILKNLFFNEDGSIVDYIDFTSSYGDEWNGHTLEQYVKAFIDLKYTINKEKSEKYRKKNGDILKLGNLSLSYKTFIGKEAKEDDLEICQWDLKENYKWTIASFEYNEEYECYELNSCLNRLDNNDINWEDFGELVQNGYEILKDFGGNK
jgi:hypothetical protein